MSTFPIPAKPLERLRAAFMAVQQADQLFRAQIALASEMLDLNPDDPTLQLNLEQGVFVLPDEPTSAIEQGLVNGTVAV